MTTQNPTTPPHQKRKRSAPTSSPLINDLDSNDAGNNSPRTIVAARFENLQLRTITSPPCDSQRTSQYSTLTEAEVAVSNYGDEQETPRKRLRFKDVIEEILPSLQSDSETTDLDDCNDTTSRSTPLLRQKIAGNSAAMTPSASTKSPSKRKRSPPPPPRSPSPPADHLLPLAPTIDTDFEKEQEDILSAEASATTHNVPSDATPHLNVNTEALDTVQNDNEPNSNQVTSDSAESHSEPNTDTEVARDAPDDIQASRTEPKAKETAQALDRQDILDPEDDGYGINGIGFRPTPAQAYARTQKRRQQVVAWRAREAREAREKRGIERARRRGGATSGVGKGGGVEMDEFHCGLGLVFGDGDGIGGPGRRRMVRFA